MFKRLKKKLEEGETSTVQPIIPGQPVRLVSEDFNSSSEQGNPSLEALVPLKDHTKLSSDADEKYDQTGDNPTSSSDRTLSRGISASSWLGGGLSAMIRGDSQVVAGEWTGTAVLRLLSFLLYVHATCIVFRINKG